MKKICHAHIARKYKVYSTINHKYLMYEGEYKRAVWLTNSQVGTDLKRKLIFNLSMYVLIGVLG